MEDMGAIALSPRDGKVEGATPIAIEKDIGLHRAIEAAVVHHTSEDLPTEM
jgi:hypothetical protein